MIVIKTPSTAASWRCSQATLLIAPRTTGTEDKFYINDNLCGWRPSRHHFRFVIPSPRQGSPSSSRCDCYGRSSVVCLSVCPVSVTIVSPAKTAEPVNRSRRRLGCGLGWGQRTMNYIGSRSPMRRNNFEWRGKGGPLKSRPIGIIIHVRSGGDATFCQITSATCFHFPVPSNVTRVKRLPLAEIPHRPGIGCFRISANSGPASSAWRPLAADC